MNLASPIYINQNFTDFESYKAEAVRWNIDFLKMNTGDFQAGITIIDYGLVQIGRTYNSGTIIQKGQTPIGYRTFALAAQKGQNIEWFNRSIKHNQLMVFPSDHHIDALSKNVFDVYTISIRKDYLQSLIENKRFNGIEKKLKPTELLFSLDNNCVVYLRSLLEVLFLQLKKTPHRIYETTFQFSIQKRIARLLLDYINKSQEVELVRGLKKSELYLHRSIDYMLDNSKNKYSITKLCNDLNISPRTLEYAFSQKYGIGPKQFSRNLKLHYCRKELLSENSNLKSIAEVAAHYRIEHLGQFSADYKKLFGELPKETKKR